MKSRKRRPPHSTTSRTLYHRLGKVPRPRRTQRIGFAWYRPEQWSRLRELATDVAKLEENYEAWLSSAQSVEADLRLRGVFVERVLVDVQAIADWCTREGRPFDSAARADYVADAMRTRARES